MQGKDKKNNWNGTPTDLIEVVKGLFESGYIKGNQTDFFYSLCYLLNVTPSNPKDLIKGIRRRKKDKFKIMQKIKQSLEEWDARLNRQNKLLRKVKKYDTAP